MCVRCEGFSDDEIERREDLLIRVHGYVVVQVTAARPWSYTMGVTESWGHPELVMVDIDPVVQAQLLTSLVEDLPVMGRLSPESLRGLDVDLVAVHEAHLDRGLLSAWEHRYSRRARADDVRQVVPGSSWFGAGATTGGRRLDRAPHL